MCMVDLKRCPFCGGDAWLDRRSATVHCNECHVQKGAPVPFAPDDTVAAVQAWNKRVEPEMIKKG